ncbi:MAG TPA: glycosyltransferase [Acidimicrobiales bacterium]|nr:glycosyltransferase [Acidimicrobiales bacterium]
MSTEGSSAGAVAVVAPVYGNEATLAELAERVAAVLADRAWVLRLVVDASPDGSETVARRLAAADDRIRVTSLGVNHGQHLALVRGLEDEPAAGAWVCLDADLQDPPEALPLLLDRLAAEDVGAVFAGRTGAYEAPSRLATGRLHRAALRWITGLPADAGAFVALGPPARDAVVRLRGPSIVAAVGVSGVGTTSLPVPRHRRPSGRSAWSTPARLRQSARTLAWAARRRVAYPDGAGRGRPASALDATQRWRSTSA